MKEFHAQLRYLYSLPHTQDWRYGQILFNALWNTHPRLANELRGTSADPFYATGPGQIVKFWEFLRDRGLS